MIEHSNDDELWTNTPSKTHQELRNTKIAGRRPGAHSHIRDFESII